MVLDPTSEFFKYMKSPGHAAAVRADASLASDAGAFALVLIFEGLMPFIAPARWRDMFRRMLELCRRPDPLLRTDLDRDRIDPAAATVLTAVPASGPPIAMTHWLLPEDIADVLPAEARTIEDMRRACSTCSRATATNW